MKDQNKTMQDYLQMLGKSEEEYREELKPTAEVRLKRGLALNEFVKQENIAVSDEEVEQQIDRLTEVYGPRAAEARKTLSQGRNRDAVKLDLLTQKGIERLASICRGETGAHEPGEPAAASASGL